MKKVMMILMALLLNAVVGGAVCQTLGVNPLWGAVGLNVAGALFAMPKGAALEGLYQEVWLGEVIKKFRTEDSALGWLGRIKDYSGFVRPGTANEADVIHLVSIGADPDVLINNTTYPLDIQRREDGDVTISLDKYQTKPTAITDDELRALSYDKMGVTVDLHTEAVNETKYQKAIHSISPAEDKASTPVVMTTGAAVSATDKRLRLTREDIVNLKSKFDAANIPQSGRVLVLSPAHIEDLLLKDQAFADQFYRYESGKILNLYGFEVYEYNGCPYYTVATKKKAPYGAEITGAMQQASVAFHVSRVAKATGTTKVYFEEPNATMQQALFALRTYFVAVPKKEEGIAAIVSGIGA